MKERRYLMRRKHNCLWEAITEAAQQNQKYPSVGDPAREEAYRKGAAFSRLVEMSPEKSGEVTLKAARGIAEPLGGRVTARIINSEPELRKRLHQGDVIVLQTVIVEKKGELHAEYVPPGGRDKIKIETVLDTVDKKVGLVKLFNILEIEWG